jgi:hypothetical protein
LPATTRATTADFFTMFDVPFPYGSGWDAGADRNAAPVIVLSREQNEKLFGGINTVGRTVRWNDHEFRIVGVLDAWFPKPPFYDLNIGAFSPSDDVYIPFSWSIAGLAESVLRDALLPFFSTKETGTGLGLTLCREIIEAHGGRLSLANRPDGSNGAVVTLWLPSGAQTL